MTFIGYLQRVEFWFCDDQGRVMHLTFQVVKADGSEGSQGAYAYECQMDSLGLAEGGTYDVRCAPDNNIEWWITRADSVGVSQDS